MPAACQSRTHALVVVAICISWCSGATAQDKPKVLRLDKKQPWLKADRISVETVGGAPQLSIRFNNDHKDRTAEDLKPLGKGTARDNFGHQYEGFSQGMPGTLRPQRFSTMKYRFLPQKISEASEVLFVSNPLDERAIYVEMKLVGKEWEVVDYGIWKKNVAYSEQDEWVQDRKKDNAYRDAAAVVRLWRDNTGGFSVRASFVEFRIDKRTGEGVIKLKREDNDDIIEVPNARLSDADQDYIRDLKKQKRDQIAKEKEANNPQLKLKRYLQAKRDERRIKKDDDDDDDDDE